ncbi:TPA: hypothetical protein ACXATO_000480 [Campylobacter jejuni]
MNIQNFIWRPQDLIKISTESFSEESKGVYTIYCFKNPIKLSLIKIMLVSEDKNIKIEFSKNKRIWFACSQNQNKEIVNIYFHHQELQFIRVKSDKISEICFYTCKYLGIFMMQSPTGWGDRLLGLLNAMYLAKQTGFNFGFVWDSFEVKYITGCNLSANVCEEKELFDSKFIDKHSYSKVYLSPYRVDLENKQWLNFEFISKPNISDYLIPPFQYDWGYPVNHNSLKEYIKNIDENYMQNFPNLWKEIGFSNEIKAISKEANDVWLRISQHRKDFIAIHARSGDIVYLTALGINSHSGHDFCWDKAMPVEILLELVQRYCVSHAILLFGEDVDTLKKVALYFNNKNIYLASDFIPESYIKSWKRDFFELILMSKINKIIAGDSGFSNLASLINSGKKSIFWSKMFTRKEKYDIFKKYHNKIKDIHPMQKAFSLIYMYMGEINFKKNYTEAKKLVENALKIDTLREFHHIIYIYCCIRLNKLQEANEYLDSIFKSRKDEFLNIILHTFFYHEIKIVLFNNDKCQNYPNIAYLILHFMKNENMLFTSNNISIYPDDSAVFRVKNSLSYRLGFMIVNSRDFFSLLKLPFLLVQILFDFKKQQSSYKYMVNRNPKLKLKPIDTYLDYRQSLNIKKHLSYQVGNALVKHPFLFPFILIRICKNWKKNKEV